MCRSGPGSVEKSDNATCPPAILTAPATCLSFRPIKVPVRACDMPCAIAVVIADDCVLGPALWVDVLQAVKAAAPINRTAPASVLNRIVDVPSRWIHYCTD